MGTGQSHAKCFAWMGPPKLPRAHFSDAQTKAHGDKGTFAGGGGHHQKVSWRRDWNPGPGHADRSQKVRAFITTGG